MYSNNNYFFKKRKNVQNFQNLSSNGIKLSNKLRSNKSLNNLNNNNFYNNNLTYKQLYIPKDNILKRLVNYYDKYQNDKNQNIFAPLRNRICKFQQQNEKISDSIKELNKETSSFINRYKLSGLLKPKNNEDLIKLGVSKNLIDECNSNGFKMNDLINKTNIFDKSLLLNKEYDKFEQFIYDYRDSELKNDANCINKIKDGLKEKNYRKQFEINYNKNYLSNDNIINISNLELSSTFTDINNTIKSLNNKNSIEENKDKYCLNQKLKENENIENLKLEIIKTNKSISDLNKLNLNSYDNNISLPLFENNYNKISKHSFKSINKGKIKNKIFNSFSPKNQTKKSFLFNNFSFSTIVPEKNKNELNLDNNNKNDCSSISSNSLVSSLTNKNKNKYIIKKIIKPKIKTKKKVNYSSLDKFKIPIKNNFNIKSNKKEEIEKYSTFKNNFLNHLYKKIQINPFNENKKEISDYLRKYKGMKIKKTNLEKGSKLYNLINRFINKSSEYNLPDAINKIMAKTNIFDYKKAVQLDRIKILNNKIKNLMYDSAEDILDLNNDIKFN